ncbi:hypothetical protein RhiirA1_463284 [Rhizophagus irregularis]|uniref:Uncharacterized protein n=1 Tax=Rhizophagus irregularis TaxID=588596 RepID=A0A2I1FQB2_9GLOM|nr:hypothetical protein RhiirA1_463284 [Rhizophagus irregularis]PKY36577.1 hypothetical protein RhiirB3_459524 [Rhizophagus irregularis]
MQRSLNRLTVCFGRCFQLRQLKIESSKENDPCMKAFKAANEKNSKILSNALDISRVIGTICKHGIPTE